jgi:hypothetical protein
MRLFAMTTAAALLVAGTASAYCPYGMRCDDTPPPFSGRTTIQEWGNGMSTARDGNGNHATIQDWGNGMTTIRDNHGNHTSCQNWGNGMTTCN